MDTDDVEPAGSEPAAPADAHHDLPDAPTAAATAAAADANSTSAAAAANDAGNAQLRLDNVGTWTTAKQLKGMLASASVAGVRKLKKLPKQDFAFVYFETSTQREAAEARLSGYPWKGGALAVRRAVPLDPYRHIKKQRVDEAGGGAAGPGDAAAAAAGSADASSSAAAPAAADPRPVGVCFAWQKGKCKHGDRCRFAHSNDPSAVAPPPPVGEFFVAPTDAPPMPENAADCVTPWRGIAYPDQLAKKRAAMLTVLQTLPKQMRAAQRSAEPAQRPRYDALSWLQPSRLAEHGGAPCSLAEVVPSPRLKGYRNKCEFTIGKGADGNACVGYQLGKGKLGQTMVGAPTDCTNVPPEMLAAVAVIQEWLLRDGQLATFDKWGKGGVWRQIVARLAFASTVAADGAAAAGAARPPPTRRRRRCSSWLTRRCARARARRMRRNVRRCARRSMRSQRRSRRVRSRRRRRCRSRCAWRRCARTRAASTSRRRTRCRCSRSSARRITSSRCAGSASACRPPPSSR